MGEKAEGDYQALANADEENWGKAYEADACCLDFETSPGDRKNDRSIMTVDNLDGWKTATGRNRNRPARTQREAMERFGRPNQGHEWVLLKPTVDSGAVDTLTSVKHVKGVKIRETNASRAGMRYTSASKHVIKNLGEAPIQGKGESGENIGMIAQVGDKCHKMLIAVRNCVQAGNMVIFGDDQGAIERLAKSGDVPQHAIINKKTGGKSEIHDENGAYKYHLYVQRPIEGETGSEGDSVKMIESVDYDEKRDGVPPELVSSDDEKVDGWVF